MAGAVHHHPGRGGRAHARARRHARRRSGRRPRLGRWPHRHHRGAQVRRAGSRHRARPAPGGQVARQRARGGHRRPRDVRPGRRPHRRLLESERGHRVSAAAPDRRAAAALYQRAAPGHAHRLARLRHDRLEARQERRDPAVEVAPRPGRREPPLPLDRAGRRSRRLARRRAQFLDRAELPADRGRRRERQALRQRHLLGRLPRSGGRRPGQRRARRQAAGARPR